jgi:hypothetical protein
MKYLDLIKPHGYLIWKGKQKAIVSPNLLLEGQKMLIVQEGQEAFGEIVLSKPSQINLSEFGRLEEEHGTRPEERKLRWPDQKSFYIYRFKEWLPFTDSQDVEIDNGDAQLVPLPELTDEEIKLLEKAERLPKTLILNDNAVTLEDGQVTFCEGLDGSKVMPILSATFDETKVTEEILPLYQLALVRIPRLKLKKNMEVTMENDKAEGTKPYKIGKHDDCGKQAVIKIADGKLMGCHETSEEAAMQVAALYAKEDEDKAVQGSGGRDKPKKAGTGKPKRSKKELAQALVEALVEDDDISEGEINLTVNVTQEEGKTLEVLADEKDKQEEPQLIAEKALAVFSDEKEQSLDENMMAIRNSFDMQFIPASSKSAMAEEYKPRPWVHKIYKDYVLVRLGEKFYKVTYGTDENSKPKFADKSKWAEIEFAPVLTGNIGVKEFVEEDEKAGKKIQKGMMAKLKAAWATIKEIMDWAEPEEEDDEEHPMMKFFEGKSSIGIKKVGDEYWYVTWSANAFQDREKEIFSTKSLESYVVEAEKKEDRGYFNLWHIGTKAQPDLTDFAEKKWQGVIGRFLVEGGPFLKTEKGKAAFKFFKQYSEGHPDLAPEGWGCSVEYRYLPEERKTGIYKNVWITRTSTLPKLAAANIWTQGGITMALTKEQQKAAELIFGEELTKQIVKTAEDKTKELEEAGVAHKGEASTEQVEEVKEEKQVEEKPVEVPAEEVIVQKVAEKMTIDWQPIQELMTSLVTNQKALESKITELEAQLSEKKVEETQKAKDESPKYVWSLVQRASEAEKTIVADGDPLKDKKPLEAQKSGDQSGASHFFGK